MLPGDGNRIAHMVAMAVGQRYMGYALGRLFEINPLCTGISVQKRIDENNSLCRFNAEAAWPNHVSFIRFLLNLCFGLDFRFANRYDADKVEGNMKPLQNPMRTDGRH